MCRSHSSISTPASATSKPYTWAAAGCNTNLGIVLLCAPLAAAVERREPLRTALHAVLGGLDVADAAAAYRAIARANR